MKNCTLTQAEDRLFMLDLAIVQLIASILVTLGSTLFAISIGFELTIPSVVKDAFGEIIAMRLDGITEIEQELLRESMNNYVLFLSAIGILLIIVGVIFASVKMNRMKKRIRKVDSGKDQQDSSPHVDERKSRRALHSAEELSSAE